MELGSAKETRGWYSEAEGGVVIDCASQAKTAASLLHLP